MGERALGFADAIESFTTVPLIEFLPVLDPVKEFLVACLYGEEIEAHTGQVEKDG